jgi:hypothetical protein
MAFCATVFSVPPGAPLALSQILPRVTVSLAAAPVTGVAVIGLRAGGGAGAAACGTVPQGQRGYYGDPGMGPFHPVAWCQYYDGGKAWLTTLGHDAGDWESPSAFPGAQYFQQMLLGGIESAMGMKPFCQGPAQQNGS